MFSKDARRNIEKGHVTLVFARFRSVPGSFEAVSGWYDDARAAAAARGTSGRRPLPLSRFITNWSQFAHKPDTGLAQSCQTI